MDSFISIFAIGMTPGIFWLWIISRKDKIRPEPRGLKFRTFILGASAAAPIVVVEMLVGNGRELATTDTWKTAYIAFIVAGLVEEIGKYLVVKLTIYDSPYFDGPIKGMIYGSSAALGFSSIENVKYMMAHSPAVIISRSIICTLGHVCFASPWAYALGYNSRSDKNITQPIVYASLVFAIILHGAYDYFIMLKEPIMIAWAITFFAGLAMFVSLYKRAIKISKSSVSKNTVDSVCIRCKKINSSETVFCVECGNRLPSGKQVCKQCGKTLRAKDSFWTECGKIIEI